METFVIGSTVVVVKGKHMNAKGVIEAINGFEAYVRFIGRANYEMQADFIPLSNLMHYEFNY